MMYTDIFLQQHRQVTTNERSCSLTSLVTILRREFTLSSHILNKFSLVLWLSIDITRRNVMLIN